MTTLREAAQQALELLGTWEKPPARLYRVMDSLRAALAQEQAEPVAWLQPKTVSGHLRPDLGYETCSKDDYGTFPVYTAPPKAEPVQEPVAWIYEFYADMGHKGLAFEEQPSAHNTPLYTAPTQRKPLTEEEISCLLARGDVVERNGMGGWHILPYALARAVERAHGIGGQDD